jgi:hypothetical protein
VAFCGALFSDICLFAEHTFIVLGKELIQGEFVVGNPHTEGLQFSSRTLYCNVLTSLALSMIVNWELKVHESDLIMCALLLIFLEADVGRF